MPRRGGIALGIVLLAAGCARPVAVEPPAADAAAAQACSSFLEALPESLAIAGLRRETSPESTLTAAYGDPPISIRCGVPVPDALTPTSELVTVEGVDWLPEELTAGWLMTTVGRIADVEITVPDARGPAPSIAAELAAAINATLPPA